MQKRGLSAIIASLLIVVITISAVLLVWQVVKMQIEKSAKDVDSGFGSFQDKVFGNDNPQEEQPEEENGEIPEEEPEGCIPDCEGKECGDDGCEGSCGGCEIYENCEEGVCICNNEKTCSIDYSGECGTFDDGCGGTIECFCEEGFVCEEGSCIEEEIIIVNQSQTTGSTNAYIGNTNLKAENFKFPNETYITSACVKLKYNTGTKENVTVSIATLNETSGFPETYLTNFTINKDEITSSFQVFCKNFNNEYLTSPNTSYYIVLESKASSSTSTYYSVYINSNIYPDGRMTYSSNNGTTWSFYNTYDIYFEVIGHL